MTALALERLTPEMNRDPLPNILKPGVKAGAKLFAGAIAVLEPATGFVKPGVAGSGLVCLGRSEFTVDNTLGAGGALQAEVRQGVFKWNNSAGVDAIAAANTLQPCFIVDDNTVALTSGGGARSVAGRIVQVDSDGVWVLMGVMVDPSAALAAFNALAAITGLRARCVGVANANLATALVAGQTIDGVTLAAGDRVLLVAQATPAQNGLYVATAAGAASFAPEWQLGLFTASGVVQVSEGTVWNNSEWKAFAAQAASGGYYVVGTTDPLFYPRTHKGTVTLSGGTFTLSTLFAAPLAQCSILDTTAAAAVKGVLTPARGTGQIVFTGTTTDVLAFVVTNF